MRMLLVFCAVAALAVASAAADFDEDMIENQSSTSAPTRRTRPPRSPRPTRAPGQTRPTENESREPRTTQPGASRATRPARTTVAGATRSTRPPRRTAPTTTTAAA